jgi:hypothetical protein
MNAELLKRFQDTRKKIDTMEFDPDPMVSTRFPEQRPKIVNVLLLDWFTQLRWQRDEVLQNFC